MEKDISISKPKTADDNCQDRKPLEIYMFIDPLCPECWALEPIMKKLQIEYGRYFSLKHVLSGRLSSLNCSKKSKHANIAEFWEKPLAVQECHVMVLYGLITLSFPHTYLPLHLKQQNCRVGNLG